MSRLTNKSMKERFEEKYEPVTESGCWIWNASSHGRGYGLFYTGRKIKKGKMEYAHRVSYEIYKGYRPSDDESVCHKCDNTSCVNPDLFIGSHQDNMTDMINKGRLIPSNLKLTEQNVIDILNYPASNKETALAFGIDAGHCSRLRNFKIKHWEYLKNYIET